MPFLAGRVHELATVEDLKLLDRSRRPAGDMVEPGCSASARRPTLCRRWVRRRKHRRPGPHAPLEICTDPLRRTAEGSDLQAVQERRLWPVRATQAIQVFLQNRMIGDARRHAAAGPPWPARLLNAVPFLRRIPAACGVGCAASM